jgi:hypothetical protein
LFIRRTPQKNNKIGIIAHNNDFNHIRNLLGTSKQKNDILLIPLKTKYKSVEEITDEICSCKMILSTSLHGLIVPHAYGIPALRIDSSRIHGDGVKFMDYFLSVGIPPYEPLSQDALKFDSPDSLSELFSERQQYASPAADISKLQADLLKAAPFSLKEKFASFCKTSAEKKEG